MARITTNTTGTQPVLQISTDSANIEVGTLSVICLQDVTITNSTGVYSYTTFCDTDTLKISTPADNEISTNIVLDNEVFFGNASATSGSAAFYGLSQLSIDKIPVLFRIYYNGTSADAYYQEGNGFLTSLAPTVSPDAPVWVSPMTLAINGSMVNGQVPTPP